MKKTYPVYIIYQPPFIRMNYKKVMALSAFSVTGTVRIRGIISKLAFILVYYHT